MVVQLVELNQLLRIMYDLKKKEAHLQLANQLIDQIDLRVDFLTRQKATLRCACKIQHTLMNYCVLLVMLS
jgi:hypothetical protein